MKVLIDQHESEDKSHTLDQYIDLDQPISFPHPDGSGSPCNTVDALVYYMKNPAARENAGYNVKSKLKGEKKALTRWERIVKHTESDEGHPVLKEALLG